MTDTDTLQSQSSDTGSAEIRALDPLADSLTDPLMNDWADDVQLQAADSSSDAIQMSGRGSDW